MKTITVSESLIERLNIVKGSKFDEKIFNLLETNALMRLKECKERIFGFGKK